MRAHSSQSTERVSPDRASTVTSLRIVTGVSAAPTEVRKATWRPSPVHTTGPTRSDRSSRHRVTTRSPRMTTTSSAVV